MPATLLPQAFWFRLAIPCRRLDALPRPDGKPLNLPEECRLPDFGALEGKPSWAEVRAAWSPRGLALAFEVSGKAGRIAHDPAHPELSDGVNLWIDTRDTRDVHRATRFCHRFRLDVLPVGRTTVDARVEQRPIHRALADAPIARVSLLQPRAERSRTGWRLELFLPAEALNGFDPETNRRLGYAYQVTDPARGDQFLTVGREFPIAEDPSLWATLELRD